MEYPLTTHTLLGVTYNIKKAFGKITNPRRLLFHSCRFYFISLLGRTHDQIGIDEFINISIEYT